MASFESEFLSALASAGIPFAGPVKVSDRIEHFKAEGDSKPNSWYILRTLPSKNGGEPVIAGGFGCWKRQISEKWSSRQRNQMSKEDWAAASLAWKDSDAKRKAAEQAAHAKAQDKCRKWFSEFPRLTPADGHMYLMVKGIDNADAGPIYLCSDPLYEGWLALPLQDVNGVITSAQFISDDGQKKFCYQGKITGSFFLFSDLPLEARGGPIMICEGYATGATIAKATGWPVVCAMNCGNLAAVAADLRKKFPSRSMVIAADNDQFTDENPGLAKARAVAKSSNCLLAWPDFGDEIAEGEKPTDFNDLFARAGIPEVRRQILSVFPLIARPIGDFILPNRDDPTELLRYRFLSEAGMLLVSGPTGMGKSSWMLQAFALWANNRSFFDIQPSKPLKSVIIQAENDDGDIAEMRDGICRGLDFNEDERRIFFENVLVFTSRGLSGMKFCREVLRPILDLHGPNMIGIDPALAFIGGDFKNQEVVGEFLREGIAIEITQHRCGAMMMHHTNKPTIGKEKGDWKDGDMAYLGGGSQEFANWCRAGIALQSSATPGFFTMHGAKRGARLAWTDPVTEALTYQKKVAWAKNREFICWREPDPEEIQTVWGDARTGNGKSPEYVVGDILDVLASSPVSLTADEWQVAAYKEGISRATFFRLLRKVKSGRLATKSAVTNRYLPPVPKEEPELPPQDAQ